MRLLVVNAGSSTLRYSLRNGNGDEAVSDTLETRGDITAALATMFEAIGEYPAPDATGHRVVHGGASLTRPVVVDDRVAKEIDAASRYAPLHNPANLEAIEACRNNWPDARHVAVFDTAFHATLPEYARRYALPAALVERHGLRRFGFHGISHEQLMLDAAEFLGKPARKLNLITLHLGNGASATAIRRGRSIDTSMGMTPTEGLVMGTRSGDVDAGLLVRMSRAGNLNAGAIDAVVNKESGLLGLCGDADMRKVRARALAGDSDAEVAIDVYVYRMRKYIGAYLAVLGSIDAIVFSGGVGEHHPWLIGRVLSDLPIPGLALGSIPEGQPKLPANFASNLSQVAVLVLAADETRSIARQVSALLD